MTNNQINHRAYLQSELWKAIRSKAISYYGNLCNSCRGYGADVHHKTYARVGGRELMSDLEVLCRDCHEAKHSIMRNLHCIFQRRQRCWVNADVAYRYLTPAQKQFIRFKFGLDEAALFSRRSKHRGVMLEMRRMLGVNIIECRKRVYLKLVSPSV